jgi:HSP20 family protein
MALTKHFEDKLALPVEWSSFSWPSWKWLDEMFRDVDGRQMIKIEEFTEGDQLVVRAELPGIDPDKDVDLEVVEGTLMIACRKVETEEHEDRHFHRSEFRYGTLVRNIPIPKGVDEKMIKAVYADGILEVRVPMPTGTAEDATHRIAVTHA